MAVTAPIMSEVGTAKGPTAATGIFRSRKPSSEATE